ncbi:hypothetical protein LguiB_012616 [Lonicera macranthoides]
MAGGALIFKPVLVYDSVQMPANMPQNQQEDPVFIRVRQKLNCQLSSSKRCIFRVHNELRQVNEKAYEPNIIAIGPYHHGKIHLMAMEEHKLGYLSPLGGNTEMLKKCVDALRKQEEDARRCYAESFNLGKDEWVEMMLLDGCFIIELVHKFYDERSRGSDDPIFEMDSIVNSLQRDLLLFENQLPFFVLCDLFDIIKGPDNHPTFVSQVLNFFGDILPGRGRIDNFKGDLRTKYKHLLGVVHNNWRPSLLKLGCNKDVKFIHCVTELREAGIKFKKGDDRSNLFNIVFKNGVLQIPNLTIEDRTETVFGNLIAYEQRCEDRHFHFVCDYVKFVDCLINSPNDVSVLCRNGIIDNWLGDDDEVSSIFNKLNKSVVWSGTHFHYSGVFEKVNEHYSKQANRWMAKLWRNYLNGPWAFISVLAAIVLLVLTFLQTLYTIKN